MVMRGLGQEDQVVEGKARAERQWSGSERGPGGGPTHASLGRFSLLSPPNGFSDGGKSE